MPGKFQYDVEIKTNVAKLLENMKEVQDRLDDIEGKEHNIKVNINKNKLQNDITELGKVIAKYQKTIDSYAAKPILLKSVLRANITMLLYLMQQKTCAIDFCIRKISTSVYARCIICFLIFFQGFLSEVCLLCLFLIR